MEKKQLEKNILTDPMMEPNEAVLEKVLGVKNKFYIEFLNAIGKRNLIPEWKYYNDTKTWLCRILKEKKNYCWLSIVFSGIKLIFYFKKDTINDIYKMDINERIKELARDKEAGRKNPPVTLIIENKNHLNDALRILDYRIGLE